MKIGDKVRATRAGSDGPVIEGRLFVLTASLFEIRHLSTTFDRRMWTFEVLEEALDPEGVRHALMLPSGSDVEDIIRAYLKGAGL